MMRHTWRLAGALALLLLGMVWALHATGLAQSLASVDLGRHVVADGGGRSASASYQVHGTAGQPAADPSTANSAHYRVTGGFWVPMEAPPYRSYLPSIQR